MIKFAAFCIIMAVLAAAVADIVLRIEEDRSREDIRKALEEIENQRRKQDGQAHRSRRTF